MNLLRKRADVVRCGDARSGAVAQAFLDVREPRPLLRMQQVPTPRRDAVALQLVEAGDAPNVAAHIPFVREQVGAGQNLAQNRTRSKELHARPLASLR